jgi:hypothetical protein
MTTDGDLYVVNYITTQRLEELEEANLFMIYLTTLSAARPISRRMIGYNIQYSGALVRQRTIPTERPPLVCEVSANFSG